MKELLKSFWTDESGQGLAEYAILIALVTLLLIFAITAFGNEILRIFEAVTARLAKAG